MNIFAKNYFHSWPLLIQKFARHHGKCHLQRSEAPSTLLFGLQISFASLPLPFTFVDLTRSIILKAAPVLLISYASKDSFRLLANGITVYGRRYHERIKKQKKIAGTKEPNHLIFNSRIK